MIDEQQAKEFISITVNATNRISFSAQLSDKSRGALYQSQIHFYRRNPAAPWQVVSQVREIGQRYYRIHHRQLSNFHEDRMSWENTAESALNALKWSHPETLEETIFTPNHELLLDEFGKVFKERQEQDLRESVDPQVDQTLLTINELLKELGVGYIEAPQALIGQNIRKEPEPNSHGIQVMASASWAPRSMPRGFGLFLCGSFHNLESCSSEVELTYPKKVSPAVDKKELGKIILGAAGSAAAIGVILLFTGVLIPLGAFILFVSALVVGMVGSVLIAVSVEEAVVLDKPLNYGPGSYGGSLGPIINSAQVEETNMTKPEPKLLVQSDEQDDSPSCFPFNLCN
jgi:hypothetical protein